MIAAIILFGFTFTSTAEELPDKTDNSSWSIEGFIGGTDTETEVEPTFGIATAYKINRNWTVGVLLEGTNRGHSSVLYMGEVVLHPNDSSFKFALGLGEKDPSGEHETTIRAGLGYEIELEDDWFIKPYAGMDFIENEEEEIVFGFYFGRDL